ncbi:VCBS repeat-containing protein [Maliponia aquimaris]|uniref:FG-GAP repeat protein n=1 Tax=Maliponia aquimaris TaxID=1673631 RepID=A0A238KLH9_9RHOB|nr:VCBS repeat-containing protein [Maliponia aquimaris]SMX43614.1 hypothetical protein MAA8898_02869 [Maliponia aquimaris]
MPEGAPRLSWRPWRSLARGACFALALVAGGAHAEGCTEAARYGAPTDRYAHGVLGDAIEWGSLTIERAGGRSVTVTLPPDRVFEDVAPRLVDLGPEGCRAVLVVETQAQTGAQLALYGADGVKLAATPHIGQPNRWLAPVGAADLDGDGAVEIAYVDRPHLARVLRVWRYSAGRLTEVAAAEGFTNHRIGWDYIAGGLRDCGAGPEMVLATGDWRQVVAVRFDGGLTPRALGPYSADRMARALDCR